MQRTDKTALLPLAIEKENKAPLHRQLYEQIRELILTRRLSPAERLPSTRKLAQDLGVSRNTVSTAFDQLHAEGYLEGKVGAGSFVSSELPDDVRPIPIPGVQQAQNNGPSTQMRGNETDASSAALSSDMTADLSTNQQHQQNLTVAGNTTRRRAISNRGKTLMRLWRNRGNRAPAFAPGLPAVDDFPFDIWSRLMAKSWRNPPMELLAHANPSGYKPLREAIANYLRTARAVNCTADQVIIVSGAQQGIGLAANVLLDDGETAMIEEPGYPGIRGALLAAGAQLAPVSVDAEGLDIDQGERDFSTARLVCVAPSHQYPLGVTMSLNRRLKLLEWASHNDSWIIEDDYDSEFRYSGRPLAALQGLDKDNRVVYVGSFSKVMFPSLRLGYIVVPPDLTDNFRMARAALDDHPSTIAQPALAKFIEEGYFTAHLRRMRKLYDQRRQALSNLLATYLSDYVTIESAEAGMHLVGRFKPEISQKLSDQQIAQRAEKENISITPLSVFYYLDNPYHYGQNENGTESGPTNPISTSLEMNQGLLFGYAAIAEKSMIAPVQKLQKIIEAELKQSN